MTAAAPSALSEASRTVPLAADGIESQSGGTLRALALAALLALFATAAVTAAALAIVAGPFHTSLRSL